IDLHGHSNIPLLYQNGRINITEPQPLCQENIQINDTTMLRKGQFMAEKMIESNVLIQPNKNIRFQASDSILLLPGFSVIAGGSFSAIIAPTNCVENLEKVSAENRTLTSYSEKTQNNPLSLSVHPNPANVEATIQFELTTSSSVSLHIFNQAGQRVKTYYERTKLKEGRHQVIFQKAEKEAGVYFVQLKTDQEIVTKKMIVLQ
ncbi:MAG: 3-coathanger stack domain-containing protein, partial [Bacteroidota bacterium]